MARVDGWSSAPTAAICPYCGYGIPATPVRSGSGTTYCSNRCREAAEAGETPFAGRFGFKQYVPNVAILDSLLQYGIPATSFVLLTGDSGIRHRGLQTELLWRALERGNPAVVVTYVDPPIAIVEHFLTFGWNVLPALESGDLRIIDCFTSRLRERHQTPDHEIRWNRFLDGFLDDTVSRVKNPTNLHAVESRLHAELDSAEMAGSGIIVIDSLNEVEFQATEFETEQFIKEIRADVCSWKYVPIFTSLKRREDAGFVTEHDYLFDGIVQMRRTESLVEGVRLKQLSIKKMDGVLYRPHWVPYVGTWGTGFQPFDPVSDMERVYGSPPNTAPHWRNQPTDWRNQSRTDQPRNRHESQPRADRQTHRPEGNHDTDHPGWHGSG